MDRQDAKDAKEGRRSEPAADLDRLAHQVIGAAMEVHRSLGLGFLESVYEEALRVELELRGVPFVHQAPVEVRYKGHAVGEGRQDLLIANRLIIERKAVEALAPIRTAQVLSYLRITGRHLGLLINFNGPILEDGIKRIVLS